MTYKSTSKSDIPVFSLYELIWAQAWMSATGGGDNPLLRGLAYHSKFSSKELLVGVSTSRLSDINIWLNVSIL